MSTLDDPRRIIDPISVSVWPTAIRYGLIVSLIGVAIGLITHLAGLTDPRNQNPAAGMGIGCVSIIITIVGYVMAMKKHRDEELGGAMSLGRAIGLGTAMSVIMGTCSAVWNLIMNKLIAPDMAEMTKEAMMGQAQPGQEEFMEKMADFMTHPIYMPLAILFGTILMGVILSLIIGAIMKKDPPPNF